MPEKQKPKKTTGSSTGRGGQIIMLALAAVVLVLSFLWQYVWKPEAVSVVDGPEESVLAISASGPVRLSEVMTKNQSAFLDDRGEFSDWIELYNTTRSPVDVSGWMLAKKADDRLLFTFPEGSVLGAGECVVVFASKDLREVPGYSFHAPFNLSASGDAVILCNPDRKVMESVNIPRLEPNQVYRIDPATGEWGFSLQYTPGSVNTEENHLSFINSQSHSDDKIRINEIMADNASYAPDEDGEWFDWIELYNEGDSPASLAGYALSDEETMTRKWVFPDVTIDARSCLIVYASGKNRRPVDGSPLHLSFKLNAEGETVILTNTYGQTVDRVRFENLKPDISFSRKPDGGFTQDLAPTPGQPNTREGAALIDDQWIAQNPAGVFISKVSASSRQPEDIDSGMDWVELHNKTNSRIDLGGFGISNSPSHPRKWQFPNGAYINPGEYLKVGISSEIASNPEARKYTASFGVKMDGQEEVTLCTPEGAIIDRVPLLNQRASVAYGRVEGRSGFFFLPDPEAGKPYSGEIFEDWVKDVSFSSEGGLYPEGGAVTLYISASEGSQIRYTTDCREPTEHSELYTGPIELSKTTVVRARAYEDGKIPSYTATQTYFFGVSHTMPVVSVVSAPDNLYSNERGILVKGPGAYKDFPYGAPGKGANFWQTWERTGNVEIYDGVGTMLASQGIGLSLSGAYSRAMAQKAFFITARNAYGGGNRFHAKLLPNRPFTEYKSFVLRGSGQDGTMTRMRDSVLTTLAEGTGVLYQDTRLVVVYLNGEYYGQMNLRERNNRYMVAQHMGWKDLNAIDIVKANEIEKAGSNKSFAELISWLKINGCRDEASLARVAEIVDIDNYLSYVAIQMFVGNADTLNVKRYRSVKEGDGKWRWMLYDLDWAMFDDVDSYARWLNPKGMGNGLRTDNTLFVELMKNESVKVRFLTIMGELMATNFDKDAITQKIDARSEELKPEMPAHVAKYNMKLWSDSVNRLKRYVAARPKKLLGYIRKGTGLSPEEMRVYFGAVMEKEGL